MDCIPQPKSSEKRIGVVTQSATGGQLSELLGIASAKHNVIGIENFDQALYCVGNMFGPFSFAQAL